MITAKFIPFLLAYTFRLYERISVIQGETTRPVGRQFRPEAAQAMAREPETKRTLQQLTASAIRIHADTVNICMHTGVQRNCWATQASPDDEAWHARQWILLGPGAP